MKDIIEYKTSDFDGIPLTSREVFSTNYNSIDSLPEAVSEAYKKNKMELSRIISEIEKAKKPSSNYEIVEVGVSSIKGAVKQKSAELESVFGYMPNDMMSHVSNALYGLIAGVCLLGAAEALGFSPDVSYNTIKDRPAQEEVTAKHEPVVVDDIKMNYSAKKLQHEKRKD